MNSIFVKKIYLHELDFFYSDVLKSSTHIPISKNRIKSYLTNPRKNLDKPVLYLGYIDEQLVAYRSILQDQITLENKTASIAWLSGVWTHPEYRKLGYATKLLDEIYIDYGGRLLVTNLGKESYNLIQKNQHFDESISLEGHRFYYRLSLAEILPPKSKVFKVIKPILKIFDQTTNLVLNTRFNFYKSFKSSEIKNAEFNSDLKNFLSLRNENSLFERNTNEFEWILDNPWIKQKSKNPDSEKNYHFTSTVNSFQAKSFVLKYNDEIAGFILYSIKNGAMKIHYFYTNKEEDLNIWIEFIFKTILQERVNYLLTTNVLLINLLKLKKGFLYSKNWKKEIFISNQIRKEFPLVKEKEIFMGDGDSVFT